MIKQITLILLIFMLSGCSGLRPRSTGLVNGKLQPCPPAPKCVSSYYTSGIHHIEPLAYSGSKDDAYKKLISIIEGMEGSQIVNRSANYLHAQFELRPIRWVDNVEFLFLPDEKIIHYCSSTTASVGYWDWGENKRRAKIIRTLFME